ncbi:MAG TPA: ABC transporter permease [Syntrophomonadaceae bacterium]|nr:ABC transporter permease [Syntrophomonadaceae bacterium]
MTFKGSLFSKGVMAGALKRFWWVGALYGIALLLILPFDHMMRELPLANKWAGEMLRNTLDLFSGAAGLQVLLLCTVPVILAVLLFQYLHNGRATAVLHSLPLDRKTLFLSHTAAGLVLLLMPVLVTGLVLLALNATTLLKLYYTPVDILRWIGMSALFDTLTFSIAVFVGMFTGNAVAQIIFTYILQVLPVGLYMLLTENLRYLVYGYVVNPTGNLRYNFPLMLLAGGTDRDLFTAGTVAVYLLVAVLFLVVADFVYRMRPAEAAGEVIAFPVLRPVFKYGVTACAMLLAGGYFAAVYRGVFSVIALGYVLGSLLGYLTAEALLQKSLKIWSSYRGYLGYAAVVAVLLLGIATDVTGYVHRVPDPAKVKEVYYGPYINYWMRDEKTWSTAVRDAEYRGGCFFEDRNTIEKIVLLHRQLLKAPRRGEGTERYIVYTLENGTYLARRYSFDERDYASLLKPVYESREYKRARFPVVIQYPEEIKLIEIGDLRTPKRQVILANREEIGEFAALLRRDVLDLTFEELTAGPEENMYADIVDAAGNSVHYNLRPGYGSVIGWLKEKGYYEQIALLPEEIEYAVLEYLVPSKAYNAGAVPERIEIRDRRLIEELLNISGPEGKTGMGETVDVTFYGKAAGGNFQYHRSIRRDWPLSEGLREYLERLD